MNLALFFRTLLSRGSLSAGLHTSFGRTARVIDTGRHGKVRIRVGENSRIEGELLVFAHSGEISIGDWCFIGPGTRVWSGASIQIGNRVMISHNVNILDNLTHPIDPEQRHLHFRHIMQQGHPEDVELGDLPVVIEDDAWIAASATVLRGVRIGRGAIIGAGSVVTADVSPMTVVAGNPARVIRKIQQIDKDNTV